MSETETEIQEDEPAAPAPDDGEEAEAEEADTESSPETPVSDEPEPDDPSSQSSTAPEDSQEQPGLSDHEFQKIARDAASDWKRLRARTIDRWGPDGQRLVDCPLCLEQHKGLIDPAHAGQYPKEIADAVMGFLGMQVERNYKSSGKHNQCSFCDGEGKVATGSNVPEHRNVTCPECKGFGYTPPPGTATAAPANGAGDGSFVHDPHEDIVTGDFDNWNEPRLLPDGRQNPNYGKQPAFKTSVEPYGVTAGLGAPVG